MRGDSKPPANRFEYDASSRTATGPTASWPPIFRGTTCGARAAGRAGQPKSAESAWVQYEVQFWKEHGRAKSLLIVLTDGEIRLTASSETTITTAMLWNVGDLPDVVARATELACAAAGPGFTEQEWNVRAPGLPYRRLCP